MTTGALLGPLALLALAYGRKKSRGKWDMLVILLVLGLSLGLGLAACKQPTPAPSPAPEQTETPTPTPPQPTETPGSGNDPGSSPTQTGEPSKTPTSICTNTPTPSPTPTPKYPEIWMNEINLQFGLVYNSDHTAILNWTSAANDDNHRAYRAGLVWKWMILSSGWWNNYTYGPPSVRGLSALLLVGEGSYLLNNKTIEANPSGSWERGISVMVRLMGEDFNNDNITDKTLSKYTAFFNPRSDSVFDSRDWDRINRQPENFYYSYVDKYITQPVELVNGRRVDRWWDDRDDLASGYCSTCIAVHTVKIPLLSGDSKSLFFGYVP